MISENLVYPLHAKLHVCKSVKISLCGIFLVFTMKLQRLSVSLIFVIHQMHVTSSPLAALFKVLLEDQQRIVCIEFQWKLLLSVDFLNILSLKVASFLEFAKTDKTAE